MAAIDLEGATAKIISVYRELIAERYQFEKINATQTLSPNITPEMVQHICSFFLNDVYPDYQKRIEIEHAFHTLSGYVNQPKKAIGLFGSITGAIFIFGKHLPAAINAGVVSLQSFLDARKLEHAILTNAESLNLHQNINRNTVLQCIAQLPQSELKKFVADSKNMFRLLSDSLLLEKTIRIIDMVIQKMKSKPKVYSVEDVKGITFGKTILENGLNVFKNYPAATKEELAQIIYQTEMNFIAELPSLTAKIK